MEFIKQRQILHITIYVIVVGIKYNKSVQLFHKHAINWITEILYIY